MLIHIDWGRVWDYLYGNRVAIGSGLMLITTAAVKTAPPPGVSWNATTIYTWSYDWWHQTLNITNTRLTTQVIPTPPESKLSPR